MSDTEAQVKATRFAKLSAMLTGLEASEKNEDPTIHVFWVPGRIEVLGKHTDYGGGRSLLCAVERGICVVARAQPDQSFPRHRESPSLVRITDAGSGDSCEFEFRPDVAPAPGHWSNYPITVARRIAMNFSGSMRGANIIFESDLPPAAGVSSSSALVVSIFLALSTINDLPSRPEYRENIVSPEDLGGYLGCVENGLDFKALRGNVGVGTFGGSEDQTAILCARANTLVQYSFCPVTFERAIALPDGCCFIIASSGVTAAKTGAALERYNRVSRRLTTGLDVWRRATGRPDVSMGAAANSSPDAPIRIREMLQHVSDAEYSAQSLIERFDQFLTESNEIIPAAGDALKRGDLAEFGSLVALSQQGAELALENQIPETIALAQQATGLGAIAASAFGAGFGGSVWALVNSSPQAFCDQWKAQYSQAFPENAAHAEFFVTRAGPAALQL
ncbi:MAG: galactokinase family protein [Gemmatimonadaceae bacterium]